MRSCLVLTVLCAVPFTLSAEEPKTGKRPAAPAASIAWVPEDAIGIVVTRPSQTAEHKTLGPLIKLLLENVTKQIGVSLTEIDTLTLVIDPQAFPAPGMGRFGYILTSAGKPLPIEAKQPDIAVEVSVGENSFFVNKTTGVAHFTPDNKTVIVGSRHFVETVLRDGKQSKSSLLSAKAWSEVSGSSIAVAVSVPGLVQLIPVNQFTVAPAFTPLWQNTKLIYLGLKAEDKISLLAYAEPADAATVSDIKDTLQAAVTLARNMADFWSTRIPPAAGGAIMTPVRDLLKSAQVEVQDERVRLRATLDIDGKVIALVAQQVQAAREGAKRNMSINNLKQIALAMHNHHDVFKRFPAAVNVKNKAPNAGQAEIKGQPCSWRVLLLPYLEENALYQQYKFDEPWDSENNKKILEQMPAVYRNPLDAPTSMNTSYFALTGPDTVFFNEDGANIRNIPDGTSNTIMIVEAKGAVPWTKPDDIEYVADKPVPELGGWFEGGFNAALCDGSVRFFAKNLDEQVLRAMITRRGGEAIGPQ